MDGNLIGVNSFILSQSGQSSGVGFAIPAAVVRRVVETAMGGGHAVVRPWLGARLQSVTPEIAKTMGLADAVGRPGRRRLAGRRGGPRRPEAGRRGHLGRRRAGGRRRGAELRLRHPPARARPLRIGVRRDEAEQALTVRAEAAPATPGPRRAGDRRPQPLPGRDRGQPVAGGGRGDRPRSVRPGRRDGHQDRPTGAAQQVGVQPGDIIRAVNGRDIKNVRDLTSAVVGAGAGLAVDHRAQRPAADRHRPHLSRAGHLRAGVRRLIILRTRAVGLGALRWIMDRRAVFGLRRRRGAGPGGAARRRRRSRRPRVAVEGDGRPPLRRGDRGHPRLCRPACDGLRPAGPDAQPGRRRAGVAAFLRFG